MVGKVETYMILNLLVASENIYKYERKTVSHFHCFVQPFFFQKKLLDATFHFKRIFTEEIFLNSGGGA